MSGDVVQAGLFDVLEGKRRRDNGMAGAARGHSGWLELAREVAVQVCRRKRTVCADCLREAGIDTPADASPNIWGSVFKGDPRFEFDAYVYSARPEAHHNLIRSWRLAA